jgi:hypothetical protein
MGGVYVRLTNKSYLLRGQPLEIQAYRRSLYVI